MTKAMDLRRKAGAIRRQILQTCIRARTGHVTSSLSAVEILVTLYHGGLLRHDPAHPRWEYRDRFFLSKGQASPLLYAVLADRGFFSPRDLLRFARRGGRFGVHLQNDVPGVEITCGSLGQGFGLAVGAALAARMDRKLHLVFALLGDGECYEGSIWEAAMFAAHQRLNNLVAIVDRNYQCVTDFTENIVALEPLEERWRSFGWQTRRVDGHSPEALYAALAHVRSRRSTQPLAVIADTVKGRGIACLSNIPLWHGLAPQGAVARQACAELQRSNV